MDKSYFWATQAKIAPKLRILAEKMRRISRANLLIFTGRLGLMVLLLWIILVNTSFRPFVPLEYGLQKVVIDAGHGGKDPGSIGYKNMKEKDVALSIALKVGESIKKKFEDVEVVYTRDTDVFIKLNDRAKIANKINADLFMSIHADAATNKSAYGTETFALGLHRSAANLETAKRENAVILMEDNYEVEYEGFDPNSDESVIAITMMQSANLDQSLSLADKVQNQFIDAGRKSRGVKQAGFLVLYKTTMPAVLIETGFISNSTEGLWLQQENNRDTIAAAIVSGFGEYKSEVDSKGEVIEQTMKTPIPKKPSNEVVFKVQIASSSVSIALKPSNFKGLEGVEEIKVGNVYKYTVGSAKTFDEGINLQRRIRKNKYKDAFLIALKGEERIPISQALDMIDKNP